MIGGCFASAPLSEGILALLFKGVLRSALRSAQENICPARRKWKIQKNQL